MKIEDDKKKGKACPQNDHATAQPAGLTLEQYAAAKALPISLLQEYGLSNAAFTGRPAVRIPYFGADGATNELCASVSLWPANIPDGNPAARHACMV